MILECSHCGAPLDVGGLSPFTRCNYCGRTSRTRQCRTQQAVTPHGWAPPPQWLPPPQFTVHVIQPLPYKRANGTIGCVVVAFVVLPMIILMGAGAAVWLLAAKPLPPPSDVASEATAEEEVWDGTSTLRCDGSNKIEVSGVHMKVPLDEVVVADGNCVVEIEDSTLKGAVIVRTDSSARVFIKGGNIEAGRTIATTSSMSKVAIDGTKISVGSARADTATALEASMSSEVELARADVTVKAREPAKAVLVDAGMRARVRLVDGHYKGPFGIKASAASEVRKEGGDVEAWLDVSTGAKVSGFKNTKTKSKGAPPPPSQPKKGGGAPGIDPLSPFGPTSGKGQ